MVDITKRLIVIQHELYKSLRKLNVTSVFNQKWTCKGKEKTWEEMIKLHTQKLADERSEQLTQLRNMTAWLFTTISVVYIATIFSLDLHLDLRVKLKFIPLSGAINPIGLLSLILCSVLLAIQFLGMLFSFYNVFLVLIANTSAKCECNCVVHKKQKHQDTYVIYNDSDMENNVTDLVMKSLDIKRS